MAAGSQESGGHDSGFSTLNVAINSLSVVKDSITSMVPAQAAFGSVTVLLTMIRDFMVKEQDYVELGLNCAHICEALERGMIGKKPSDLSRSICEAINQLTITVAQIQKKIIKQSRRSSTPRLFYSKNDQEKIVAWRSELSRILHVFNTELIMNIHTKVSNIGDDVSKIREEVAGQIYPIQIRVPGESPPPPPRAFFGRDELIESILGLAANLYPIALIGSGGIGKTSIALSVLHNDRTRQRFGDNRRFIRCDQIPPSRVHFLNRLSKVIGAGVENAEDLTPFRPFLSSQEIFLVLDNAESILDPHGSEARQIFALAEELSQFKTVCLCITSRITTVPRHCKRPVILSLSMEAACDIFYSIYDQGGRSEVVGDLLRRLDFHALSITLLATVASHNMWDHNELVREWETHRAQVLRTDYNESLAATIELSLASPTFRELGPDARELLGVVSFFPQGIDKNNLDWLFRTIPDRKNIFNKFCTLSLTYRNNDLVAMLAPIRDYLCPQDPRSSPLLCAVKNHYFDRLSVHLEPGKPSFEEAQWIKSEDLNVEHLLDVFTSIDPGSDDVWSACSNFMEHLYWHKNRLVVLKPAIEGLPDSHFHKPECLFELSRLFQAVGNYTEQKRLLTHALKLEEERGNDYQVARALRRLSDGNRRLELYEEGIEQINEALRILGRLGDAGGQAQCLISLAWLLYEDNRLDAAGEAASFVIGLLPEKGQEFRVCQSYRIVGEINRAKGEREKAIRYLETALGIASPFNWRDQLFWIHHSLADLFSDEGGFDDAYIHIEQAKAHIVDDVYSQSRLMLLQALVWHKERRFEEAKSEALRATEAFENLGAAKDLGECKALLQNIQRAMDSQSASDGSNSTVLDIPLDEPLQG